MILSPQLDPELIAGLELFPAMGPADTFLERWRELGRSFERTAAAIVRVDVRTEGRLVPGRGGDPDVRVLMHRAVNAGDECPVIIWLHGGGFVFGSPEGDAASSMQVAADLNCMVVSVDYRLAPETRTPGAVEDCFAVLDWINANAAELGVDRSRIAVWGFSAGGGLAASLALLARDRGGPTICFQLLVYPMLDDRTAARADIPGHLGQYVWTRDMNAFGWQALLGEPPGSPNVSQYAAPARAQDLRDLPPTYISAAALDLFVEENVKFAMRLLRAGAPTELHVVPGAYHGFEMNPEARATKQAYRDRIAALRRAFER